MANKSIIMSKVRQIIKLYTQQMGKKKIGVPLSKWHEIIGEQTIAHAILDRIVHDAHRIEMK